MADDLLRRKPPSCCDDPDIQTFGPNEVILTPTRVCMTCGCLVDNQPDYGVGDLPVTYHLARQIEDIFRRQKPIIRKGRYK